MLNIGKVANYEEHLNKYPKLLAQGGLGDLAASDDLVNILDIPNMNQDREQVLAEFNRVIKDDNENIILPLASIIETGNHIAHISDGNLRRNKATKFSEFLIRTATDEAPWQYYGRELTKDYI